MAPLSTSSVEANGFGFHGSIFLEKQSLTRADCKNRQGPLYRFSLTRSRVAIYYDNVHEEEAKTIKILQLIIT